MGDTRERIIYEADATAVNRATQQVESRFAAVQQQVRGISGQFQTLNRIVSGFGALTLFQNVTGQVEAITTAVERLRTVAQMQGAGMIAPQSRAAAAQAHLSGLEAQQAALPSQLTSMVAGLWNALGTFTRDRGFGEQLQETLDRSVQENVALAEEIRLAREAVKAAAQGDSANRARAGAVTGRLSQGLDPEGLAALRAGVLAGKTAEELLTVAVEHLARISQSLDDADAMKRGRAPAIVDVAAAGPE